MSWMKTVKAALIDRLQEIVRELVPGGRLSGGIYSARNPARADRNAGSFVVWLKGPAAGAWKDYATGEQGDIIDLVVLAKGCDRKGELQWAADRCGMRTMSSDARRDLERRMQARRTDQVERERHDEARAVDRARRLFAGSDPNAFNVPTVVRYLGERGIDYRELKNIEDGFRFRPAFEHWASREAPGKRGPEYPALVSAMVDAAGVTQAVHLTFLAPDGSAKAPVDKPKLMWPRTQGLVIRVARGYRNRNAETAAALGAPGMLALTEGIEDALSVALSVPEMRVWAAGSLPGLLHVPDHGCALGFIVFKDNDWGKPQAAALFDRAIARLQSFGKPVEVLAMPGDAKDVNDYLRGAA